MCAFTCASEADGLWASWRSFAGEDEYCNKDPLLHSFLQHTLYMFEKAHRFV